MAGGIGETALSRSKIAYSARSWKSVHDPWRGKPAAGDCSRSGRVTLRALPSGAQSRIFGAISCGLGFQPSRARAEGNEKLVQLRECLNHHIRRPGAGSVESFLRGIKLVHDQQRLAAFFLEGHRRDGTLVTFLIGPDEARVRCYFLVRAEERRL